MQRAIETATQLGISEDQIAAATSMLQARRTQLQDVAERYGGSLDEDARGKAKAIVMQDELVALLNRQADSVDDTYLFPLHRMTIAAQSAGVERFRVEEAQMTLMQLLKSTLDEEIRKEVSLESLSKLSTNIDICNEASFTPDAQLADQMVQAQQRLEQHQDERATLAVAMLNKALLEGAGRDEITCLEDAVDAASEALKHLHAGVAASAVVDEVRRLVTTAEARLERRAEESKLLEAEKHRATIEALNASREQLDIGLAAARAAVEANAERLRIAQDAERLVKDVERMEQSKQELAAKHLEAQQQAKKEQDKLLQNEHQQILDAKEEVKRLKWSLKLQQDGAHAATKKAEQEASLVKKKAQEEARQAVTEAKHRKRELEQMKARVKSESERKTKFYREQEIRQAKIIHEQEERLRAEEERVEKARKEAETAKAEQAGIVGSGNRPRRRR